jgi:hypothetical protein
MGAYAGPDISENGLVLALDAANKKSYSQNEFQYSTDIYSWVTSGTRATLSRDTISSPVGNTPLKMEVTGNDPYTNTYNSSTWNIAPAANGQTWIVSVYVKASVATTGEILIFGANSSGVGFVGGAWLSLTASTVNIGTEWTRVQHVHTMNDADVAYIHLRLDGPHSGGDGQTVWWDGLQVERVPSGTTTPTPFTSAYYGGSVYRDLVGSNNFTLSNPSFYFYDSSSGSIDFNRTLPPTSEDGGYATFTASGDLTAANYLHNDHTTEVWFKSNNRSPTAYDGTETQSAIVVYRGYHSMWYYSSTSYYYNIWGRTSGVDNTYNLSFSDSNVNVWTQLVAVRSGTTLTLYKNGVQQNSGTITSGTEGTPTSNDIRIAVANYNGNYAWHADMNFGSLRMYKKALTASEIQQNYIATKSRFGL